MWDIFSHMETTLTEPHDDLAGIDQRIARRLRSLRAERGWSLDDLASRTAISRATLSRLENADVSPTAVVLGKLCAAYGMTMSRLMRLVEDGFEPVVRSDSQSIWTDPETGFRRRSISPPSRTLAGEAIECRLEPGTHINYGQTPRSGLEHHLVMLEGELQVTVDGIVHTLFSGDCLRFQLSGASTYATPPTVSAHYILFIV